MKNELKKIRDERSKLEKIEELKPQKRKVELVEHEDGTYSLIGFAWNIPLEKDEVLDAIDSWIDKSLEEGFTFPDF